MPGHEIREQTLAPLAEHAQEPRDAGCGPVTPRTLSSATAEATLAPVPGLSLRALQHILLAPLPYSQQILLPVIRCLISMKPTY